MLKLFKGLKKKSEWQMPSWAQYRLFLSGICKFQNWNDTYANIARLHKSRFFVLHHELYTFSERLLDIARLENDMGWKANYFVPNTPDLMQHPPLKKLISLGHDVGLLYDMLGNLSERYSDNPKELYQRAWAQFGDILRQNHALNIRCIAPYVRKEGIDNSLLWQRFNYRVQNILCDSDLDFREDNIITFLVQKGEIQYFKRDIYGRYLVQKSTKSIQDLEDLGKRLKHGLLVPRVVVKIRWE